MKVKVEPGWQLGLPEGGKLYYEGDTFDAPDELANEWIAGGQAKAVTAAANKAVTTSANKAVTTTPKKAAKTTKKG